MRGCVKRSDSSVLLHQQKGAAAVEYAAVWTVMNSQQAAAVLGFKWLWCSVMQCGLDGVARGGGEDAQGLHLQLHPESDLHTASQ